MNKNVYNSKRQSVSFNNRGNFKNNFQNEYIKADRKARREKDRDIFGDGFKVITKVHKSEKSYSRKGKNKFDGNTYED